MGAGRSPLGGGSSSVASLPSDTVPRLGEDPLLATKNAVARLLRRASELVAATPTAPTRAPLPPWHDHRVDSIWFGVAWSDAASATRLRGECSLVASQEI